MGKAWLTRLTHFHCGVQTTYWSGNCLVVALFLALEV